MRAGPAEKRIVSQKGGGRKGRPFRTSTMCPPPCFRKVLIPQEALGRDTLCMETWCDRVFQVCNVFCGVLRCPAGVALSLRVVVRENPYFSSCGLLEYIRSRTEGDTVGSGVEG